MICPSCGTENIDGSDRCENCLSPFRNLDIPSPDAAEGLARHVMEDRLSELEKETPIIVAPETPAIDVARRMKESNTGCALVVDGSKLVGIFTEHDVLRRVSANRRTQRGSAPTVRGVKYSANERPRESGSFYFQSDLHDESARMTAVEGIPLTETPFRDIPLEEIRVDEMFAEEAQGEAEVQKYEGTEESNDLDLSSPLAVPVKN